MLANLSHIFYTSHYFFFSFLFFLFLFLNSKYYTEFKENQLSPVSFFKMGRTRSLFKNNLNPFFSFFALKLINYANPEGTLHRNLSKEKISLCRIVASGSAPMSPISQRGWLDLPVLNYTQLRFAASDRNCHGTVEKWHSDKIYARLSWDNQRVSLIMGIRLRWVTLEKWFRRFFGLLD